MIVLPCSHFDMLNSKYGKNKLYTSQPGIKQKSGSECKECVFVGIGFYLRRHHIKFIYETINIILNNF